MSGEKDRCGEERPRGRWKARLAAFLLCIPILLLLEGLLALLGYGGAATYFVKSKAPGGETVMVPNAEAFKRTFQISRVVERTHSLPRLLPNLSFRSPKPKGTCRVFVLGASTVKGFPHAPHGSFPYFLQLVLDRVTQGKRIEVINCGVTAISTYSVADIAREVLRYEPDLLVVYAGHNEFYGAYGAGSAISLGTHPGAVRTLMWIRNRRIYMMVGDVLRALRSLKQREGGGGDAFLITVMARDKEVRYGDTVYRRALASYRQNLQRIVRAATKNGVPVLMCTLTANLRDCAPLGSVHATSELDRWRKHFEAGRQLLASSQWDEAAAELEKAAELDPEHAETLYFLARALEKAGKVEEARRRYEEACRFDVVRFRADESFNQVVREVVEAANSPLLRLVDASKAVKMHAPNGIVGAELVIDHVHPTLKGNFIIAEAIARAFSRAPFSSLAGTWDWDKHADFAEYRRQSEFDVVDEAWTMSGMTYMYNRIDLFKNAANRDERLQQVNARVHELFSEMDAAQLDALRQVKGVSATTYYEPIHSFLAQRYLEEGEKEKAVAEWEKVLKHGQFLDDEQRRRLHVSAAHALLTMGEIERAKPHIAQARVLDPADGAALALAGAVAVKVGEVADAAEWVRRTEESGLPTPPGLEREIRRLNGELFGSSRPKGSAPGS